jgi:pimeloyl-ACP methyl ester carboxylesterase
MPRTKVATGIEIEYETFGSASDPTVLLVSGFTAQLLMWPADFCRIIAEAGFHVIRFDNRDCGLSTKLDGQSVDTDGVIRAALLDDSVPAVPYTLSDMAADAVGLLDALGITAAHVIGGSMGGMIVQVMAIEHPSRVASLTSIMSNSGEPEYGEPTPEAMEALVAPPPTDRAEYIDSSKNWMVWQSKKFATIEQNRIDAAASFDRSFYPQGAGRQLAAIYASGRRTDGMRGITAPTLVIHGTDDTLIAPSGGRRAAELIPNARLDMVTDMGHDLPRPLWPRITESIIAHLKETPWPAR